jgi:hypothetical protein
MCSDCPRKVFLPLKLCFPCVSATSQVGTIVARVSTFAITNRPCSKTGVSDNVGGVKFFLSTQQHALNEERHFALAEEVPFQPRLAS